MELDVRNCAENGAFFDIYNNDSSGTTYAGLHFHFIYNNYSWVFRCVLEITQMNN